MHTALARAASRKAEQQHSLQHKGEFLRSVMGRGVILLSLSLIKYRFADQPRITQIQFSVVGIVL